MTILISGNVVDGLHFYGPFKDSEDALSWAERNLDGDWWITTLVEPLDLN